MTSTVYVMPPLVGALKSAIEFTGKATSPWLHITPEQRKFLNGVYKPYTVHNYLNWFSEKEMRYLASFSTEELNKFLKDNGFSIQLDRFETPDEFGTVSVMDILVEWIETAQSNQMIVVKEDKVTTYPSIKITKNFETFESDGLTYAQIDLKQNRLDIADRMFLVKGPFSAEQVKNLREVPLKERISKKEYVSYSSLTIPKIDLDCESDLSFLLGMKYKARLDSSPKEEEMCLSQALQQTKFKLNERGARAKSAAAVAVLRSCTSIPAAENPLVFDEPFILWMLKEDLSSGEMVDYFAAYLDIDCWKDPGNISNM